MKSEAARWSSGGWKIFAVALPILVTIPAAGTGRGAVSHYFVLTAVRASAITALLAFIAPFTASAALALHPSALTRYLRGRRRYFGIVFAFAMLVHIGCVALLFRISPDQSVNRAIFMLGVLGYLFIAALFATSFDRTTDLLGGEAWHRLHLIGSWYVWAYFLLIMLRAFPSTPAIYGPLLALAFGAAGFRWTSRNRVWLQPLSSTR